MAAGTLLFLSAFSLEEAVLPENRLFGMGPGPTGQGRSAQARGGSALPSRREPQARDPQAAQVEQSRVPRKQPRSDGWRSRTELPAGALGGHSRQGQGQRSASGGAVSPAEAPAQSGPPAPRRTPGPPKAEV